MYVDGIIFTRDFLEEMLKIKIILAREFEIKDLRTLRYFLGMEVARPKNVILYLNRNML